jgi:predicted ATPase
MAISRIKVSNFKSFDELDLELRPLNVVVGANATGKSNFLEIFRFLRDLAEHGLADAVSRQGGMEFLYRRGGTGPLRVEVTESSGATLETSHGYRYALELKPQADGVFEVAREELIRRSVDSSLSRLVREGKRIEVQPDQHRVLQEALTRGSRSPRSNESVLEVRGWELPSGWKQISFFDLDPKPSKDAVPISGSSRLEPNGNNLAIVLRNLFQDEERRQEFLLLVQSILPFVGDVRVDRFTERHLLVAVQERYALSYLPASFLSDGTIEVLALIVVLYFEQAPTVLVEEPWRHLHPHLLSRLASMLQEAAQLRQIVVTTHNPELVKHAELDDLLLVHRDEQGRSRILRPSESREVQIFLENDLGVEDLFVQDLLSFGHAV